MNCPYCHHEILEEESSALQITPETVVDRFDMWLGQQQGTGIRRLTEKLPVICIETNGTEMPRKPTKVTPANQPR